MRNLHAWGLLVSALLLFSCKKEYPNDPHTPPPPVSVKKVLLKDVIIPRLPSPYYHFEYNKDSMVSLANFASGFTIYDVLYKDNKVSEMRNNIIVNHDTLRYEYNRAGKMTLLKFINQENVLYRHVRFAYHGDLVKEIEWDHKDGDAGFLIDRTLTFTYYSDGNLEKIIEYRPAHGGTPDYTTIRTFENYDDKVNVDDFSLIHDGIHDHLFLLQGFRLQKNNPRKETLSGDVGTNAYTANYTYTYNSDNTPSSKAGQLVFSTGADAGKIFQLSTAYTYY